MTGFRCNEKYLSQIPALQLLINLLTWFRVPVSRAGHETATGENLYCFLKVSC